MEREYNEAQAGVAGAGLSEFIGRYEGGDPRFYDLLRQIGELHGRKNTDYTKGSLQGHLGNFHRSSSFKRLYPGFDWNRLHVQATRRDDGPIFHQERVSHGRKHPRKATRCSSLCVDRRAAFPG